MSHTTVNSQERVFQFNLRIILFSNRQQQLLYTWNYTYQLVHNLFNLLLLQSAYTASCKSWKCGFTDLHEPLLFLIYLVTNCNKKVVNFSVILAFFIPIMITTRIYDWSRTWIRKNLFSVSGSQLSGINYSISYPFSNFNEEIRTLTLFSLVHHNSRMNSGSQKL